MVQIKDIKARIKGIQGTQKITKAMESISLIRLQRAESRALASRPLIHAITDFVSHLEADNIYYSGNRSKDALFVVFTSDRGLCGAFNDNLIREAVDAIEKRKKTGKCRLIPVGMKAVSYFKRRKYDIYSSYSHLPPVPTVSLSNLVMNDCVKLYLGGKVGEVFLVYDNFMSKLKYEIRIKKMLPLPKKPLTGAAGIRPVFLYEPEKRRVVDSVVHLFLESTVFHSFLDLYASECSARLMAMSKATDSAQEMIDRLVLELHKTRQALITKEILEVISGAEALAS